MKSKSTLEKLRFLTTRKDKIALFVLLIMTFFLSIIETIGIGIIMPFITFASNPALLLDNKYGAMIYHFFNFSSPKSFMFAFSATLIFFYVFRSIYTISYNYMVNLFAYKKYHNLAYRLYQKILHTSYMDFVNKNSDHLRRGILNDALHTSHYVRFFLLLNSEILTIALLYTILLIISWKMTLVLTFLFGAKVLLITKTISRTLGKKGEQRVQIDGSFLNLLSTTFGNFKIIKIKDSQSQLQESFLQQGFNRAKVEIISQTLMGMPKNLLETIGFCVLIACVAYILYQYQDANAVLPIISMYALALYKVLPSINKILDSFNYMKLYTKSLTIIYDELKDIPQAEGDEKITFNSCIELQNISFSYQKGKSVIKDFSLTIQKGEKVAFIGPSGSGKSTLVDLIAGFYTPSSGEILIDGQKLNQENIKSWRKKIGYIPQNIYLFDGSVADNITFGSQYDQERIIQACKKAKIYDFLQEHEGIQTMVGDGGIKLSGGQKQRIGIARAIYDNPEILVLDEATSALDNETEAKIMDEIYDLSADKTLLVIAHRLSTIERCDRQIQVNPHKKS